MKVTQFMVPLASLLLSSCGVQKKIDDVLAESERVRKTLEAEMEKTRQLAKEAADAAILAVPGERYLQVIDHVHRGTDKEKAEAQAFLKSLFRIDFEKPYEVSAVFSFSPPSDGKKIHAQLFLVGTPDISAIRAIAQSHKWGNYVINSAQVPVATEQQVTDQIHQAVETMMAQLVGPPVGTEAVTAIRAENKTFALKAEVLSTPLFPAAIHGQDSQDFNLIRQTYDRLKGDKFGTPLDKARAAYKEALTSALMATIQPRKSAPGAPATLKLPYLPMVKPYLVILMPKADLETLKSDSSFKISTWIHETNKPEVAYTGGLRMELDASSFDFKNTVTTNGPDSTELCFAIRDLAAEGVVDPAMAERIRSLRTAIEEYEKLRKDS